MSANVLTVKDFNCWLSGSQNPIHVSRDINMTIEVGSIVAIVGESGSGKSVTFSRLFKFGHMHDSSGEVSLNGQCLNVLGRKAYEDYRNRHVGFVLQDPSTAFNPTMTVGDQLIEASISLGLMTKPEAIKRALYLLEQCDIYEPEKCLSLYPHQLSGGMLQRCMLVMAMMHKPQLLIADEPTTALDAINVSKVLTLIRKLCTENHTACILITHDFSVVNKIASHVGVMYAGQLVEFSDVSELTTRPKHPYTQALQSCRPHYGQLDKLQALPVIEGQPPNLINLPSACAFHPRCKQAMNICAQEAPKNINGVLCWLLDE